SGERGGVPAVDRDVGSFARKEPRDSGSNTARTAGHEGDLLLQDLHLPLLFTWPAPATAGARRPLGCPAASTTRGPTDGPRPSTRQRSRRREVSCPRQECAGRNRRQSLQRRRDNTRRQRHGALAVPARANAGAATRRAPAE